MKTTALIITTLFIMACVSYTPAAKVPLSSADRAELVTILTTE